MKTFRDLFNNLQQNIHAREILCISAGDQTLYHRAKYLKEMYDDNFDKKIYELAQNGNIVHCIYSGKLVKEFVVDWTEYIVTGWTKENIESKYNNLTIPYAVQLLIARFIECDAKPLL